MGCKKFCHRYTEASNHSNTMEKNRCPCVSPTDYQNLLEMAHSTHDPRQLHRAQALLWLHEGDTVEEVATRLFITPRTVFRWRSRFHARQALELPERLADGPRSGRPNTVSGIIDTLLSEVIDGDHRQWGYPLNRVDRAFMASISARCPSLQGLTPQCGACPGASGHRVETTAL